MTRLMYDSVTASDIPVNAQMVAGYINGRYAWSQADWNRFPNAVKVRISVTAFVNDGDVVDCEAGDATPAQAAAWVRSRWIAGAIPTVYCSSSVWSAVRAAVTALGVAQPNYWLAQWDNVPAMIPGAVAKQYCDPPASGGHYDLSVVANHWPGVDKEVVVTPEEHQMLVDLHQTLIEAKHFLQLVYRMQAVYSGLAATDGGAPIPGEVNQLKAELDKIGTPPPISGTITGSFHS